MGKVRWSNTNDAQDECRVELSTDLPSCRVWHWTSTLMSFLIPPLNTGQLPYCRLNPARSILDLIIDDQLYEPAIMTRSRCSRESSPSQPTECLSAGPVTRRRNRALHVFLAKCFAIVCSRQGNTMYLSKCFGIAFSSPFSDSHFLENRRSAYL